jgi:hypothetical protein
MVELSLRRDLEIVWERGANCIPKKFKIYFFAKK